MKITYSQAWKDYELIDAGNEKKLERWGDIITIRPDRNAYFTPVISYQDWKSKAHYEFIEETNRSGKWVELKPKIESQWTINFNNIKLNLHLTKFKHLGIFPEQRVNWDYIASHTNSDSRFLNLFGYTGAASLVAKTKGADVYHCDSVKQVITWAKENMLASNLKDIHWVLEDALRFAQREVKRKHKYHGLIMDPPAFGIGAKKKRWKIENMFPELLDVALKLRERNGYIIANTYSPRLDATKIQKIANSLVNKEKVEITTLSVNTTTGKRLDYGQRLLISS